MRSAETEFRGRDGAPVSGDEFILTLSFLRRNARAPYVPDAVHRQEAEKDLVRAQSQPVAAVEGRAYINHGRWVVDCLNPHCRGAELVHLSRPLFFCGSCLNDWVGGALVPIKMPTKQDADLITTILESRPLSQTQNWSPSETIESLL